MNNKPIISLALILLILILETLFLKNAYAGFDVRGVQIFRDGNLCVNRTSSSSGSNPQSLNFSTLQTSDVSVFTVVSSSGSFCPPPPFFTGGAILGTTSGKTSQAQPVVQALSRGILISEGPGTSGAVSSSGEPTGFLNLINSFGGVGMTVFEISLPSSCDVVDDDNDAEGASTDLTTINDFTLPLCSSTNGLSIICNQTNSTNLLSASNILVPSTSGSPAKIRFAISEITTFADSTMIDSILIKLDSQDIFCSQLSSAPLTATVTASNAIDSPSSTQTIGTADLGTPIKALGFNYAEETALSAKGESSKNTISTTAVLTGAENATGNTVEISELDNESISVGGLSVPAFIEPASSLTTEITMLNLWLVPTSTNFFAVAPSSSDISFSDDSLILNSSPYVVKINTDDFNAPFGSLVIPVKRNTASGASDPSSKKTTITIKNLSLNAPSSSGNTIVSLQVFDTTTGTVINTPGGCAINNSTNINNPVNFSAYSPSSTRAFAQNAVVSGAANDLTGALQITTNNDLASLASRNSTLGTPQISGFLNIVSMVTDVDVSKITGSSSSSVLTLNGAVASSIGGAKVNASLFISGQADSFDSVTVTSAGDGSFTAKLKSDFSMGDVTVKFKQSVGGTFGSLTSKSFSQSTSSSSSSGGSLSCDQTVCGCSDVNCTPSVNQILTYIQNKGGLADVITAGGAILDEVVNSIKKALGLG